MEPTASGTHECYMCKGEFEWNFIVNWLTPCEIKAEKNPTFANAISRDTDGIIFEVFATCPKCYTRNKLSYTHKINCK